MGDICANLTGDVTDVCFLEEPEHLNWYKASHTESWTDRFEHVVGIGHTNYLAYLANSMAALATPTLQLLNSWMVRAYCHKLIKLSGVLQTYAPDKEVVCNVHGIRRDFLLEGQEERGNRPLEGAYFLGKLVWAKGLDQLIELEGAFKKRTGDYFPIDIIGSGPEQEEIERAFSGRKRRSQVAEPSDQGQATPTPRETETDDNTTAGGSNTHNSNSTKKRLELPKSRYEFRKTPIPARFLGRQDHLDACKDYKVFVNPSTSEVLCTATAEAIAMNKFVLVPEHPSNDFFAQFPNCLQYRTRTEFIEYLQFALSSEQIPPQLSEEEQYPLTWEAATQRCMDAAVITRRDAKRWDRVGKTEKDRTIQIWHNRLAKGHHGNIIRAFLGGGPVADQYVPEPGSSTATTPSSSTVNLLRAVWGTAAVGTGEDVVNVTPDDGDGGIEGEESTVSDASSMTSEASNDEASTVMIQTA
uniref:Digalactosyldiacylglycerol synthase n=1 Tax=Grammatophora oceanica TaxID=210454 RepID=A0A7S1ULM8_9STRA|mmetsp:Transcript_11196/g.16350  ORF Transcript_11196/g.16350 Transcript_11196/m.16350 type:complete len:470 (+) Transcript_11196:2-1411(+)